MAKNNKRHSRGRNAPIVHNAARVQNNVARASGLGSRDYDYGQAQQPAFNGMSPWMMDKFAVDLYFSDWAAKKIVSIPIDDMLRDGWGYEGLAKEDLDDLITMQDSLGALEQIKQALRLERLIGGCVIFMGIADGAKDPSIPVNHEALDKGCLKFMNVIPRTRIANATNDNNPLSPTFGRPIHYTVNGQLVHISRLLMFKGDPLLQAPDSTLMPTQWTRNDGFGVSILMAIYDDLTRATGSRQAAYQMIQRASVFLFQSDTMDLSGTKEGANKMKEMQDIVNQINVFRGAVVDRKPGQTDPITVLATQFGSVPELVMTLLQILSAASDIPATRFLGQAPGGLNATGESDLENYYGRLESDQKQKLRPQLLKLLSVMGPSVMGREFNIRKVDIKFEPLWSMSELEEAQIRTADATTLQALAQWLSDSEILAEATARKLLASSIITESEPSADEPMANPADALDSALAQLGDMQ